MIGLIDRGKRPTFRAHQQRFAVVLEVWDVKRDVLTFDVFVFDV